LPLADGSFDAVVSPFALLHFPAPLAPLSEMGRVLRPGGTLVIAVGSSAPWLTPRGVIHRLDRLREVPLIVSGRQLTGPGFLDRLVLEHLPANGSEETVLASRRRNRTMTVPALVRQAGFVRLQA